jgi:type VI secretion system protein VasD
MLKVLAAILLATFLLSCSSSSDKKPAAGEIKINLIADQDINPNDDGTPAPLNIFIYNVKERDTFSNADFFEIINGNDKSLQAAASKIYEAILQPGESRSIIIGADKEIATLGFIAAYRDLNYSQWTLSWDLPEKSRSWWSKVFGSDSLELNAHFKKTAITIKKMD